MEPIAATTTGTTGQVHFLNIEYFFRIIYETVFNSSAVTIDFSALLSSIWIFVTIVAYILSLGFLFVLAYATIRLKQVKEDDHHAHDTIELNEATNELEHDRWKHVESLIESGNESDWRQAIIEADIILDDVLTEHGYIGQSVGEKLKQANPQTFRTLEDAWTAHKVRNEIAHQGSAYRLTDKIAYRTIAHYRNVFQEFKLI